MYSLKTFRPQLPHVMAAFNDGTESFLLSHRTTLGELAEFVEELGSRHDGIATAVKVRFEAPSLRTMIKARSMHA